MSTDWAEGQQAAHASAAAHEVQGQPQSLQQPAEQSSSKHKQLQTDEAVSTQRVRVTSDPMQLLVGNGEISQQAAPGPKSLQRQPSMTGEAMESGASNAWGGTATGKGSSVVQNGKRVLQNGKLRNGMHGSSNALALLANGDIQQHTLLLSPDTPQSAQQLSPGGDSNQNQSPHDSSLLPAASLEPAGPVGNTQPPYSSNKQSRPPSTSSNGEAGSTGSQQTRRRSGTGQPGSIPGLSGPEGTPDQSQPPAAHRRPMMLGVPSDDSQGHAEPGGHMFLLQRQGSGMPDTPASAPAVVATSSSSSSQGHGHHHQQGPPSTTVSAPTTPSGGNHYQGPSPSHSAGRLSGSFSREPGPGAGGGSSHRNSWGPSGGGGGGNNGGGGGGMNYDRRGSRGSSYNNLPSMGNHQGGGGGGKGYAGNVRNGYGKGGMHGRASMDDTFLNPGMGHHGGGGHHHPQHTRSHSRGAHSGGPRGGACGRDFSLQGELGSTGLGLQGWGPGVVPGGQEPSATTDLERFLIQVTPTIGVDPHSPASLKGLSLEDVWRFYLEPSLYGREVYTLGGARGPSTCYFVPYLSAMQLFTPASPKDPGTNRLYICDTEGWPKHMHLRFEHLESELPFNRYPLYEQIGLLAQQQHQQQQQDAQQAAAAAAAPPPPPPPPPAQEGVSAEGAVTEAGAGASSSGSSSKPGAEGKVTGPAPAGNAGSSMDGGTGGASTSSSRAPSRQPSDNGTAPAISPPTAGESSASVSKPAGAGADAPASASPPHPPPAAPATPPPSSMGGLAGLTTIPGLFHPPSLLRDLPIMELHPASWYAVAWYPVYRIPDAPLITRFLTFHSFAPVISTIQATLASLNQQQSQAQGSEQQQAGDESQAAAAGPTGSGCPSPSPTAQLSGSTHPTPPPPPPPTPPPPPQTPPPPFSEPPQHLLPMGAVGLTWYNMHGERWLEPLAIHPERGDVVSLLRVMEDTAPPHIPRSTSRRDIRLAAQQMDMHFTAHLRELQATAERLARGYGLRMLGPMGAQELKLKHPDYEFFSSRS